MGLANGSQVYIVVRVYEQSPPSSRDVKSAFRALEVLDLFTREGRSLTFAECQRALAYPKSSLHGLLRTMTGVRWIEFDPVSKRFGLGVRAWEAGIAYTKMFPLETLARPIMERVRDATTETVQLAVLDAGEALYIAKVEGEHSLRLDSSVGQRLTAHATGVGKVLLASLPDGEFEAWLKASKLERFTPNTVTDRRKLREELKLVQSRGYAVDREERTVGAACVAVPVRNHLGRCIAAMSVSAPAVRFGAPQRKAALGHLQNAARELSIVLGHSGRSESSPTR
jgi:DNA-binding IclR family transcriptional regulator